MCLDIVLTLRNPFYPHARRMKAYLILSVISALFATKFCAGNFALHDNDHIPVRVEASIGSFYLSTYILFAVFSAAYSYRLTTRPGMSADLRKEFILRHIKYVLVYTITWMPYLGLSYYLMYLSQLYGANFTIEDIPENSKSYKNISFWITAFNTSAVMTGILLSWFRLREPIMWKQCRKYFY